MVVMMMWPCGLLMKMCQLMWGSKVLWIGWNWLWSFQLWHFFVSVTIEVNSVKSRIIFKKSKFLSKGIFSIVVQLEIAKGVNLQIQKKKVAFWYKKWFFSCPLVLVCVLVYFHFNLVSWVSNRLAQVVWNDDWTRTIILE